MMRRGRREKTPTPRMESLYNSVDFRMYCFKVLPCSKHYCHDWTECPFAHTGEKARRRDPRVFRYVGIECPQVKEGGKCPRGDLCPFAHNVFECWLHPTRYRTQLCNEPVSCSRKVCFFAHTVEELREPTSGLEQQSDGKDAAPVATSRRSSDRQPGMEAASTPVGVATSSRTRAPVGGENHHYGTPQEAALLTAALQLQAGETTSIRAADLAAQVERLSLQLGVSALSPDPTSAPGAVAATSVNDRVVQLLLMLLKEVSQSQRSGGHLSAIPMAPVAQCNPGYLNARIFQSPTPRSSLDSMRPLSLNMRNSLEARPISMPVGDGVFMTSTGSVGRVSRDSSIPDFLLYDTRARGPSLDSNISETLGMAHRHGIDWGRMSTDSSSSYLSGDKRGSNDTAIGGALRMSGLSCDAATYRGLPDPLVQRYEARLSAESGGFSDFRVYPTSTGVPHVRAVNLPANN